MYKVLDYGFFCVCLFRRIVTHKEKRDQFSNDAYSVDFS